ncbi:MAG: hypothetical protein IT371_22365, partial [Deltaproteobacteria bacterium]|nr:hypothetical protein [Deltaproteobacteria bacterium]
SAEPWCSTHGLLLCPGHLSAATLALKGNSGCADCLTHVGREGGVGQRSPTAHGARKASQMNTNRSTSISFVEQDRPDPAEQTTNPEKMPPGAQKEDLNPFDPERLRLSQDFASTVGVKKALLNVPVRKPDRQWFVRVRPGESWRLPTAVVELREDREVYLVDPAVAMQLPGEIKRVVLYTAMTRQGVLFLWPVKLPDEQRRADAWSESAHKAAALAEQRWIRLAANMSLGAYDVLQATSDAIPEPEWPGDKTFGDLLQIAFKERFIRSVDHEVVRQLLGAS